MTVGDSTACGRLAFHLSHAVAPAANEEDGDKGGADKLKYIDDPPIDPTILTAVVTSVIATALTMVVAVQVAIRMITRSRHVHTYV